MEPSVRRLLRRVSRSMYLSLRVLPAPVRDAMGLGYLFCRAADTIADTRLVPPGQRLAALDRYGAAFGDGTAAPRLEPLFDRQASAAERRLLSALPQTLELWKKFPPPERELLARVVRGVIDGMRMDLTIFGAEETPTPRALADAAALDRYCGFIGGEPGRFWTDLCLLRLPALGRLDGAALRARGVRLGKGLQMTNILRDLPRDLRIGRCYLPEPELAAAGLSPTDLLDPDALGRLRPVLRRWIDWTADHLEAGAAYVAAMPQLRLRAAVAWPLLLGFQTLIRIARAPDLLRPKRAVKVARPQVYRLLAGSPWTLSSEARFRRRLRSLKGTLDLALAGRL
jgi:farnesyl-diphosphate farnesyltransferase